MRIYLSTESHFREKMTDNFSLNEFQEQQQQQKKQQLALLHQNSSYFSILPRPIAFNTSLSSIESPTNQLSTSSSSNSSNSSLWKWFQKSMTDESEHKKEKYPVDITVWASLH